MKGSAPWLCLAAALALGQPQAALSDSTPGAPGVPGTLERFTLGNGLRVALCADSSAAAVDVAVWYDAGTRFERRGQSGIAHLFEHLMFRGSTRFGPGEHARRIEAAGGASSAFTNPDHGCFFETVPASALALALALEADRMTGLTLDQRRLDETRAGIRIERQLPLFNSPPALGRQRFVTTAMGTHPYGAPLFGSAKELDRVTLADCREWYRVRYRPSGALLTVVGRFDPAEARRLIEHDFGGLSGPTGPEPGAPPPPLDAPGHRASERGRPPLRMLWTGWTLPGRADPDLAPLALLSSILVKGEGSRADRALVQSRATCVYTDGDLEVLDEASVMFCMLALAPAADSLAVERDFQAQVDSLAWAPLPAEELEHARLRAESALLFGWQAVRGRAIAVGSTLAAGGGEGDIPLQLARLRACTPADVQRVAARYLAASRRHALWISPEPAGGAR